MSKITKELLDEIEERAIDAAKIYGDTWDSALVGDPSGKFHAITSEHTNDVVARAADDSRESSWLCDYLESVSPAAILELVKIARAAEKLVRCKGRYHSEQNYRALAAIFGVTAPDLPPLEGEQEPVVVTDDMAYAFHNAFSDSSLGNNEVEEIKTGLRAALANVTCQPASGSADREMLKRLAVILSGSDAPGEIRSLTVTAQSFVDRCKTLARERDAALSGGTK